MKTNKTQISGIMCPTDRSAESDSATMYARLLANGLNARVDLCHCPVKHWWPDTEIADSNQIDTSVTELSEYDEPALAITRFAGRHDDDLIVMSTEYNPYPLGFSGSVIKQILRRSRNPLLLLSPESTARLKNSERLNFKRIVVNHDFTPESDFLLQYAVAIARNFDAELHLISILPAPEATTTELYETPSSRKVIEQITKDKLQEIAPEDIPAVCSVFSAKRRGQLPLELFEYTERMNADLLCTALPIPNLILDTFFPTSLTQIRRNAACPVMVLQKRAATADVNIQKAKESALAVSY